MKTKWVPIVAWDVKLIPNRSLINSPRDDDFWAPLAVDAMLAVKTTNPRGDIKYPVKAVNILKAHGKSARESLSVKGYALNCTVASQGTSTARVCSVMLNHACSS